jgi:hypothetical protein
MKSPFDEEKKTAYATAAAEARMRSQESHRFAERWIPVLNVIMYGSLLITGLGVLIHMFR